MPATILKNCVIVEMGHNDMKAKTGSINMNGRDKHCLVFCSKSDQEPHAIITFESKEDLPDVLDSLLDTINKFNDIEK